MSALGGSIASFYEEHGSLYDLISEDRDFEAQASFIAAELLRHRRPARYLELFAGPACHAGALARSHGTDCRAIDASAEMRRIAAMKGNVSEDRYHVAHLPGMPSAEALGGAFDGVSVPRYSIGYLTPLETGTLFQRISSLLVPGGRLMLELHDLALVRSDFAALEIRDRVLPLGDGAALQCIWPAGPLRWHADDWTVEMDVVLRRLAEGRVTAEHTFVSVERIYARSEIEALASLAGGFRPVAPSRPPAAFQGGEIVLLEKPV
ncbi:MAG: hypothetical protein AB7O57_10070 [Hyphomicrobiaceae bacterium]